MSWPEQTIEGFLAAATVSDDRGAAHALQGLSPAVPAAVARAAQSAGEQDRSTRLARLAASCGLETDWSALQAQLPPRQRALLAGRVPRDLGGRWLRQAPPTRTGYTAPSALLDLLQSIASRPRQG